MNVSPLDVLGPVFHFLDEVIADDGVYLYLVFVWLCLILIAWIWRGGLRRKQRAGKFCRGRARHYHYSSDGRLNHRRHRQSSAPSLSLEGMMAATRQLTDEDCCRQGL